MKTLKFKLYEHKRNRYLKRMINITGVIYNHCIALHRRYYRMWGKHLSCTKLQSHIAKLRNRNPSWQSVGSQAVQEICQLIEKAYQLFFKHQKKGVRTPGFKKVKKYKSFSTRCYANTLKQAGYNFISGNRIKIGNRVYKFCQSREIEGKVKTVTIKRTSLGELFMVVVFDNDSAPEIKSTTGTPLASSRQSRPTQWLKIAGFDLGLKTFLTCSDGTKIESPQFLKQSLNAIKKANQNHSQKFKGSHNRERASKTCSNCGHVLESLDLSVREWCCPLCNSINGRDENAAINISMVGASTIGLGDVRQALPALLFAPTIPTPLGWGVCQDSYRFR